MDKQMIIDYCLTLPCAYVDYPHGSRYAAMRYSSTEQCFAAVYERGGNTCIELSCEWGRSVMSQVFDEVTPGYWMHKDNWDTIAVGSGTTQAELFFAIRNSYERVRPRLRTHDKTIVTRGKPWPVNFYCYVFGRLGAAYPDMPKDAVKALLFVLDMFTLREKEIVLARYREYRTFDEIGASHQISGSRVQYIHESIMRRIRHPSIIKHLRVDNVGML